MKKILVTGGAGFIGQYVAETLTEYDYEPIILDHYNRGESQYPVYLGDINDKNAIYEAFSHIDGFIHLAAILGTQETITNPIPSATTNIIGGLNILEAAAAYGVPGVYIGVGNHWMNNSYSISKTTVERYIDMYNRYRGTKINIVRAMNAYGPRQRPAHPYGDAHVRKITPSFICRALLGHDIEIYGDGSQVSDMVFVEDVAYVLCQSLVQALRGNIFPEPIEVGPEENSTVLETAQLIKKLCKSESKIVHLPMRPGELPNATVKANTKTLKWIGMDASELVSLQNGMDWTIQHFRIYLRDTGLLK